MFNVAWERYKLLGEILVDFQGRAMAVLFYFTIMVPFGIGTRVFGDPLNIKDRTPTWRERDSISTALDEARRQG